MPGLGVGVPAIGDADFAGHGLAPVQCLAATAVGDFKVREAASAEIVHAVDPEIRAFGAGYAEARAVGDAQGPAVPAWRAAGVLQQFSGQGLQEIHTGVEAFVQRLFAQRRDAVFVGPGGDTLLGMAADSPGQGKAKQVLHRAHAARPLERLRLPAQGFKVQIGRQARQERGEMVERYGGCFRHPRKESERIQTCP